MSSVNKADELARLRNDVRFLTQLAPARNHKNTSSLERAADFIEDSWRDAGASVSRQEWKAGGIRYQNVITSYNEQGPKRLVIGAHYDVCGETPGADDNASGVAGLLALTRRLMADRPTLEYRIDFVAYCLEEPPYFGSELMGSYVHAQSLNADRADVIGMICLEMIGYYSSLPGSQRYPSEELATRYPSIADFIVVVGIEKYRDFNDNVYSAMKSAAPINVERIDFKSGESLAGLSDHRNYWSFGYPAVMINDTSFVRNPHYHQPSDTADTLNYEKMQGVVDGLYKVITKF